MISAVPSAQTITVVVSKGQSRNPEKRGLEQALAQQAGKIDGVRVIVVPHLYDLPRNSDSYRELAEVQGDLIIASWIFPRAAHWVLDRNQIRGRYQEFLADDDASGDAEPVTTTSSTDADEPTRVTELHPRPDRVIHCVDLKTGNDVGRYVDGIRELIGRTHPESAGLPIVGGKIVEVDEPTKRRWYPVIDFDRCTNCMECIDFCLFGVYGVDGAETILVEQPDNCRKGCPACSRVCPENAIIFPQHKAPAIAGAPTDGDEGFKIDLSQLFGAPAKGDDPIATAARERDEQLLLAGRDAVGIDDQLRRRQSDLENQPKDRLDNLIDALDDMDL
ncbi:4Fe-4S dicluster domain-containing protein [Crateriforma conspicua]|uniref:4Fe-4S dicluster domain-containing protein n=1 Tax=Crateriforma conspicua TaxID=2527996 RepID=UPI0011A1F57B|nr:ferredoxin family protein [Crateriforma conspicua]